jgi:hypothetical protein
MDSQSRANTNDGPVPTLEAVLQCQISSWYPDFYNLPNNSLKRSKGTIQTVIIDLPANFRDYLLADQVQLPIGAKTSTILSPVRTATEDWSSDEDESKNITNDNDTAEINETATFAFADLDCSIERAIQDLGGHVAPKLNWSTPKDSVWMNAETLKCSTPGDVYLLLKASDFCLFDVLYATTTTTTDVLRDHNNKAEVATDASPPPPEFTLQLALRKWCDLYPSQEFRCFVRSNELVAISQRHASQHFAHVARDQYLIRSILMEFFDEIVQNKFAQGTIVDYIFDVYLDKKEKVWLIDFNVWGQRTDTLLFEWAELESLSSDLPAIRVVETEKQVRQDPLASYRAPIDTLHVASLTGGDSNKFHDFMQLCERPSVLQDDNNDGEPDT